MEYCSIVDSEYNYIGRIKYAKGEYIPLPPDGTMESIRFINHKWRCILPKVDETEKGYIKFNLNLDNLDNLDNTLLQIEVFCKKNKLESEFIIKEEQFNNFTSEQQKQIIKSIISYGFKDIVFVNGNISIPQIKCRNYFTYNYNTKRRECNKIYFRKNVNYSFDCEANVIVSKGVDYKLLNDCLEYIKKRHDNFKVCINLSIEYIGCNAKCWYCCQHQSERFKKLIKDDKNIVPVFKKLINRILELAKKENVKINFGFLGGELTILNNDIQKELAEIIDKLVEDGHQVGINSNGLIKDAPLLKTKAKYLIHVPNWKNKILEKKDNVRYVIIFTEKDKLEDLRAFKKLNKEDIYNINIDVNSNDDLFKKSKDDLFTRKMRDKKHKIYSCRYNYMRSLALNFPCSSEHYDYFGCCNCKRYVSSNEIPTLLTTEMRCPKTCQPV